MKTFSYCPNCNRDIEGLKIYQCQACYQYFCKKCNNGSTASHRNCNPISTGKTITFPKEIGIIRNSASYNSSSNNAYGEKTVWWWRWFFFIIPGIGFLIGGIWPIAIVLILIGIWPIFRSNK